MGKTDFIKGGMDELDEQGAFSEQDFLGGGSPEGGGGWGEPGDDGGWGGPSGIGALDTGGSPEFDFSDAGSADEFVQGLSDTAVNGTKTKQDTSGTIKKALPILLVLLVVVALAIGFVTSRGKGKESSKNPELTADVSIGQGNTGVTPVSSQMPQVVEQGIQNPGINTGSQSSTSVGQDTWIWVSEDSEIEWSAPIEGIFTVTDVKLFSKVVEDKKTLELKGVVIGNISGISGTYEVEVPYGKAVNLSVGTQLFVRYTIGSKGSIRYIEGIEF